ncbi:MAG: hypothetical protein AVDCRST_MAG64-492, partial [uncultured Phycisphaerae bacterium]
GRTRRAGTAQPCDEGPAAPLGRAEGRLDRREREAVRGERGVPPGGRGARRQRRHGPHGHGPRLRPTGLPV